MTSKRKITEIFYSRDCQISVSDSMSQTQKSISITCKNLLFTASEIFYFRALAADILLISTLRNVLFWFYVICWKSTLGDSAWIFFSSGQFLLRSFTMTVLYLYYATLKILTFTCESPKICLINSKSNKIGTIMGKSTETKW